MLAVILSSIIALWNICPKGETVVVKEHLTADMVVVSDCDSPNVAPAHNVSAATLADELNRSTVFVQTPDGSSGLRLVMEHRGENHLHFGDRVRLDFYGCKVERNAVSDALTIKGLTARRNILSYEKGAGVTPKVRTIAELVPSDINTYVTIKDLDVIFKDGSWYNIHESSARKMDGWASLLRSSDGRCIYMMLTNACSWRRTGVPVPQGTVSVSGILVNETNRRYGPDMGIYSIRPLSGADIREVSPKSVWKTVIAWEKPSGEQKKLPDRIRNDFGVSEAFLWTDSGSKAIVHAGYNSVSMENDGLVPGGSILFGGKTIDWYIWNNGAAVGTKAFYVKFDASKMQKGAVQFSFEWAAGSKDGNKCWFYPIDWVVEVSAGGNKWIPLKDAATGLKIVRLHNLPWKDAVIEGTGKDVKMKPGYDTAMGVQQHSFIIPQTLLSQASSVTLRIRPSSTLVARMRSKPGSSYASAYVTAGDAGRSTWIRFDTIRIDHHK